MSEEEFTKDLYGGDCPEGMIRYNKHYIREMDGTLEIGFDNGNLYVIKDYVIVEKCCNSVLDSSFKEEEYCLIGFDACTEMMAGVDMRSKTAYIVGWEKLNEETLKEMTDKMKNALSKSVEDRSFHTGLTDCKYPIKNVKISSIKKPNK